MVHWTFPEYSHVLCDPRYTIQHERRGGHSLPYPRIHLFVHRCPIFWSHRHQSCFYRREGIFPMKTLRIWLTESVCRLPNSSSVVLGKARVWRWTNPRYLICLPVSLQPVRQLRHLIWRAIWRLGTSSERSRGISSLLSSVAPLLPSSWLRGCLSCSQKRLPASCKWDRVLCMVEFFYVIISLQLPSCWRWAFILHILM